MSKKKSYIIVSIIIVAGLIIDLVTKAVFASVLEYGDKDIKLIPNLLTLTFVENDGAAYGMMGGRTWLLIVLSIAFIIGFICYYIFNHNTNIWFNIGIGLILSGAIGNLIDRLFFGGIVRDFISIEIFDFVCNIADIWITFGVVAFGIYIITEAIKEAKNKGRKADEQDNQ